MDAQETADVRCEKDGMLVGTNVWLPTDPSERFIAAPELIGCNRLFCSACRSWVRNLDNVRFKDAAPPNAKLDELFADPRAEKYSGFAPGWLGFRVYLCRCACAEVSGSKNVGELADADGWACAGHPARAVGAPVDPPPPATEADVERMLRSSAAGPPSFGDDQVWDFALRWPQPFIFDKVWPVMTKLLVDPDPMVRTRALEFVNAWKAGAAPSVARLMEIVRKHASAYPEPELRNELARTLANKATAIRSYRSTLANGIVSILGGAPAPRGTTALLAEYTPDALIQSAGAWNEDHDDQRAAESAASATAMYRRDQLLALLAALAGRSQESRERIAKELTTPLAIPDDKLALILDADDIPMPTTHPTVDEARRALGLP